MNWAVPNSWIFKLTSIFCKLALIICVFSNLGNIHVFLMLLTLIAYVFYQVTLRSQVYVQLAFLRQEHCNLSHQPKKPEHAKATHHRLLKLTKIKLNTKWEMLVLCQISSLCSGEIWIYNYTLSKSLCMQNNPFHQKKKKSQNKIKNPNKQNLK